ncbi:MAG: PAS domain S-box protein, partial [Prochlorothrix sp.]
MGPETPIEMALLQAYRTQMHRALEVAQRQQQQAANTLWDHEQRLHGAIQHAPFPLMIHAEDGEVLTISEIWTELTGYTHQDLPTTAVWAKLAYGDRSAPSPPQSSQTTEQALATWANSEKIITTRNRGQRIWRFSAAPFGFLADGRRLIVVVATDLTQERQQTQLMQSREARYRALMEGASNAIIVANCEGFIIDANQKAEELFGYAQVHLIQLHIFQLCLPADWPGIQRGFQEIVAGTRRDFPDTRIVRRDRQVIPVDISSTTIEIEGTLIVQAIIRDIRERKKTERKLKRMSDRLTLALEAAEIGCWEWDIINNQLIWDDRSYELHGISWASGDRSITYEHWLSLIHPDDTEPVKTLIQQALAGNPNYRSDYGTATPYQVDYRVIHSTGQVHYHRTHGTVLRNSQQQPQRMIGVTFDISQQKQAEIALRRSESNFRRLAENIPAVIYRHLYHPHHTSTFIYINPYVQTIYGLDPGEVIQEAAVLFNQIHPDDVAAFWRALETAAQHLEPFDSEHRIITVAGDLKWVKVSAAPTPLPEGGTLWQGVIWDVSERCEAQAKLQEQNRSLAHFNQQLERSTRLKDEFLANMSHELRTPLNAILGLTEGLQEEVFGPLHPKQFHCLRTIEESASHLLALITDILDISKIEAGQIELEYTRIAVLPFCQASLTFIRQAALRKEIQVKLDIPAALPDICADERRLRQALINLLSNAVKFTPANGTITLKAMRIEADDPQQLPTLRLMVMDTGIGIAEEYISRLFQPFVQVDSALNRQYA